MKLKCDTKIINYLLDNGANINHLLDNGLSAIMICIIRYYTSDKFLPNTALLHQDLVSLSFDISLFKIKNLNIILIASDKKNNSQFDCYSARRRIGNLILHFKTNFMLNLEENFNFNIYLFLKYII